MEIQKYLKNNRIKIIVKTSASENKVVSYDEIRNALKVSIAAQPLENKANIEIMKFFSKLLKKKVRIKSGLTSKEKVLEIIE